MGMRRLAPAKLAALVLQPLERVYDLYAAALECNRDEFEALGRSLHWGASKGERAEIARFHSNPEGQWPCGRSALLQILVIAGLLLRYCA